MSSASIIATENGFRVQGHVSFGNVADLRLQGEKLLAYDSHQVLFVIDLSDMKDQDASPLSLLLCWQRFAHKSAMRLSFVNISVSLQRMQKMFGLN